MITALQLATEFHEAYERLAPYFGYETRPETRTFSPSSANGQLMIAVCQTLAGTFCPNRENDIMNEWKPIETAPRDGTAVLGFLPNRSGYVSDKRYEIISWSGWGGGVWDNAGGYHVSDSPTHWMPLPVPPAIQKDGP